MMGVFVSCQTPELIEKLPTIEIQGGEARKVPIIFTASVPGMGPKTKAMDHTPDITSFHLVVFDQHGMYVETAEAELVDSTFTDIHQKNYHKKFKVTLTLSEEPRIIHFIANCPVDQIVYGHEASIIGNMYVKDGATAYWSRAEVNHIQVYEFPNATTTPETPESPDTPSTVSTDDQPSSDGETHFHPCTCLKEHLEHVHLLRNFAEIVVEDKTDSVAVADGIEDKFKMMGFVVYNTIHKGTVAPYNVNTQEFQCFVDHEKAHQSEGETVEEIYDYEDLIASPHFYEGHALASATLDQNLAYGPGGRWYGHDYTGSDDTSNDLHYFMYERKVSVKTDEEDKWRESPPHIIVKANYNNEICYYKFDLVYTHTTKDSNNQVIDSELRYYNILRNFLYRFEIIRVNGPGYGTIEEAIDGAPCNNLSTSTTTSGFPDISAGGASLSVSYTDTTLVDGGDLHKIYFRYKYEPAEPNIPGDVARLVYTTAPSDPNALITHISDPVDATGIWTGYKQVQITVKEPGQTALEQILEVRTNNQNLVRRVKFTLRQRYTMEVSCKPRIHRGINVEQDVQIKLPQGLTDDLFPLDLAIETKGLSLSPDSDKNSIPVEVGNSIVPSKAGQKSFYFIHRVEKSDYDSAVKDINKKSIINTHWLTNTINNASIVYVANKYFETTGSPWVNVDFEFSNPSVETQNISKGLDRDVSISFVMDSDDSNWNKHDINIILDGMRNPTAAEDDDESTMTIKAVNSGNVSVTNNTRTVTITGLKTTDPEGKVGFTLDCAEYMLASAESGDRVTNSFNARFVNADGSNDDGKVDAGEGNPVYYRFEIPTYFDNMYVYLTLDGLVFADTPAALTPVGVSGTIKKYKYKITPTDKIYTLNLKTANKEASICSVDLSTNEEYFYTPVTSTINQAMKEFVDLTVSNTRQGVGRPVTVSFRMQNDDQNYNNKTIRVSLVGMKRKDSSALENDSFTFNTSDTDVASINQATKTITLKNIVTTTTAGNLSATISADDYQSKTTSVTTRPRSQFTTFTLNPTSVGAAAGQEVTLTFNSDGLYDGLPVTIELDGLVPATSSQSTKAVDQYVHTVRGTGDQEVKLVTANTVTSNTTCSVKLMADGFETAEKTVSQNVATYALKITNTNQLNEAWRAQARYTLKEPLQDNKTYIFSCWIKSSSRTSLGAYLQNTEDNGQEGEYTINGIGNGWTEIKGLQMKTNQRNNLNSIVFNIANSKGDIYLDKVSLVLQGTTDNLIDNSDMDDYFMKDGKEVPVGWDTKTNNSNNTNPVCSVERVEGGYDPQK